ncbi:DNA replication factor cdt1 [Anaeramoeba flamelloides]|uniref:DNA replication factor cdt1 n=1 Tax=Anaeramoeba flamelloides TaxID=1746091 RepID=A0AAV7ZVR7_9EUKA|nr:DNA replication factor cdt1 [Anaeramoeba flamelloides]
MINVFYERQIYLTKDLPPNTKTNLHANTIPNEKPIRKKKRTIIKRELKLPTHFNKLYELFNELDRVLLLMQRRTSRCEWARIKQTVEQNCKKRFSKEDLLKMFAVDRNLFKLNILKQRNKQVWLLDFPQKDNSNPKGETKTTKPNTGATYQELQKRSNEFHGKLLGIVHRYHSKFISFLIQKLKKDKIDTSQLESLDLTKITSWHHKFSLEKIPEIKPHQIKDFFNDGGKGCKKENTNQKIANDLQRIEKKVDRKHEKNERIFENSTKFKIYCNKELQNRKNKDNSEEKENRKRKIEKITDMGENDKKDSKLNKFVNDSQMKEELKSIDKDIVKRIRTRERKKIVSGLMGTTGKGARKKLMDSSLPQICDTICSIIKGLRKNSINLTILVQKLSQGSFGIVKRLCLNEKEINDMITQLSEKVPSFIRIVTIQPLHSGDKKYQLLKINTRLNYKQVRNYLIKQSKLVSTQN